MKDFLEILKKVPLFIGIDNEELFSMLDCLSATHKIYKKNELILMQGSEPTHVGIVLKGLVQISSVDLFGNRTILAHLGESGIFAESFVFSNVKQLPVSVTSVTDCTILFVDYHKIMTVCKNTCSHHAKLIENMLMLLARKNVFLNQKLNHISKRTTREKLLSYLNEQAVMHNKKSFAIPYNRQELADYLCVDRSAMSNELSKLREEGVLEFNKNEFKLL